MGDRWQPEDDEADEASAIAWPGMRQPTYRAGGCSIVWSAATREWVVFAPDERAPRGRRIVGLFETAEAAQRWIARRARGGRWRWP
jgi:hypothetical protein